MSAIYVISMPFGSVEWPSLGVGQLVAIDDMFEMFCLPPNYIPETIQKMFHVGILQEPLTKGKL